MVRESVKGRGISTEIIDIVNKYIKEENILGEFSRYISSKLCEKASVKKYLDMGINYPTALSKAVKDILNIEISKPNDLLALSYIKQVMLINDNIDVINIKRTNDYHGTVVENNIVNASLIRKYLKENNDISNFIPSYNLDYIYNDADIENFYSLLKYQIINNNDCLDKFLDIDEGIENRIKKYIYISDSWKELVNNIKTKRYTYNKINRMLIHILTNLTKEEVKEMEINYVRVLGFNKRGREYLNKIKKEISIVTNYKNNISLLFDLEYRISCIYALKIDKKLVKEEYSHNPIIKD